MARSQLPQQQVKAIMAQQISRKDRLQKADDVIVNDRGIEFLKAQIIQLHQRYLMLSGNGSKASN